MISKENILELETRRNIYNYVLNNPGLHFRELERKMNISDGTLKYHLDFLQKRNFLISESTGRYNSYFVKEKVGRKDKKILGLLQKDMYHSIILSLFISCNSTRNRIISELDLDIHPNTMAYHLEKLVSMDIIEIVPVKDGIIIGVENNFPPVTEYSVVSNEKLYRLKDPQRIYDLLMIYRDELEEDSLIHFVFELMEYREKFGYPERGRIRTRPEKVDLIFDLLHEVFPHPYYV